MQIYSVAGIVYCLAHGGVHMQSEHFTDYIAPSLKWGHPLLNNLFAYLHPSVICCQSMSSRSFNNQIYSE